MELDKKEYQKMYTVRDIADILNCSKPKIQGVINTLKIQPSEIKSNKYRMYDYDSVTSVIRFANPDFDFSVIDKPKTDRQEAENAFDKPENSFDEIENNRNEPHTDCNEPHKESELEILKIMLQTLQEQLSIKDAQIQSLNERLAEAYQLNRGQLLLSAQDRKQIEQFSVPSEAVWKADEPQSRKSFSEKLKSFFR